jgi:hypothetical protein
MHPTRNGVPHSSRILREVGKLLKHGPQSHAAEPVSDSDPEHQVVIREKSSEAPGPSVGTDQSEETAKAQLRGKR